MFLPIKLATLICIAVAALGYLFLIVKTNTVTREEILLLPFGEKAVKVLKKVKFLS